MRELNPDAVALLRSGRDAFRPDASDRARVLESLRQSLGDAAVSGGAAGAAGAAHVAPSTAARGSVWSSGWAKVFGAVSVLAVGAGIAVAAHPGSGARAAAPAPVAQVTVAQVTVVQPSPAAPTESPVAAPREDAPSPQALDEAPSTLRTRPRPAPHAAVDTLPEEVRLLTTAERQLNDGTREEALATVAEHERRFPHGALTEARMAVRVEALCGLGRIAEARTDLHRLARAYPASPHLDTARKLCGADIDSQ